MMTRIAIAACVVALLAGCKDGTGKRTRAADGPLKFEEACNVAGLSSPERQTIMLVDEASIVRATPADFRDRNPGLIDAVLGIADANRAVEAGALAPRERVSLYLAPADGSSPRLMFTGCAPALSSEDRQQVESGKSGLARARESYFASGIAEKMPEKAEEYQTRLLGAVIRMADAAPEKRVRPAERLAATSLVRSLQATTRLGEPDLAPRIVLIAPAALQSVPNFADTKAAREAGFKDAEGARLDLGMAEVAVALAPARASRDYMAAFMLGSRGWLRGWSSSTPTQLSPPPVAVRYFAGTIRYGTVDFPVRVRMGLDKDGTLVDSWIAVQSERPTATPLSGSAACDADGDCSVTGDGKGFAQLWAIDAGGEPEWGPRMPFSGLRHFEFRIVRGKATGRIFDPMVASVGGSPELRFEMTEKDKGAI